MKKLTKTIVSLAIVATYATIAAQSAMADPTVWAGSVSHGTGNLDGANRTLSPTSTTSVWNMTNMNLQSGELGKINKCNNAATNVYAVITGGKTTWDGKLNADGVNFAAFNKDGFFIGNSGVVNANALMLNTVDATSWNATKIMSGNWTGDQNADIGNWGNINADSILLVGKQVVNTPASIPNSNGQLDQTTGNIVGQTVRIAAGDNVTLNIDLTDVNTNPGSNSIASLLVDPGFDISASGTNGFIYNRGKILSTLEHDNDKVGIGFHVSGNQTSEFQDSNDLGPFPRQYTNADQTSTGPIAFYNDFNSYTTTSTTPEASVNVAQIATNGSNMIIEANGGNIVDHGIISTVGDIKNGAMSDTTGYKINGLAIDGDLNVTGVNFGSKYAASSNVKDSKLTFKLNGGSDVKFHQKQSQGSSDIHGSNCYEIKTGNIGLVVDGDYTIGGGTIIGDDQISTIGDDPIVVDSTGTVTIDVPNATDDDPWDPGNDLEIHADDDIVNDTPITTNDDLIFDAGNDIINNDDITVGGDGELDWTAGNDIINNDDIVLNDNAGIDWVAGGNIVNNHSGEGGYGDNPGDGTITNNGDGPIEFNAGYTRDEDGNPVLNPTSLTSDIINKGDVTLGPNNDSGLDWNAGRNIINDTTGTITNNGDGDLDFNSGRNTNSTPDANGPYAGLNGDIVNRNLVDNNGDGDLNWTAGRNIINDDPNGVIHNDGTGALNFKSGDKPAFGEGDIINDHIITSSGPLNWDARRDIINNDDITLTGDNADANWDAGRDIINNDELEFENGADADWKAGRNIVNNSTTNPYGDNAHSTPGNGTITSGSGSELNFATGVDKNGDPVNTYPDGGDIINKHQVTNGGTANWDAGRNVINDTTGTIDNPGTFNATSGNNPNATADANGNNGDIINKNQVNNPGTMAWDAGRNVINDTTGTIDNSGTFNATSGNKENLGEGDIINKKTITNNGGAISLDAGRNVINDTTGVIKTKDGATSDGTIQLTSGNKTPGDVINDGKINLTKDSLKAVADAGNVINNGEFTSTSPNGTVDLQAKKGTGADADKGGYIIQNGTVDLTNGGDLGDGNAVKLTAGKSIITTDAESYAKLKADGIKVRPDSSTYKDANGNSVTKITPANNGILAKAADDIINNGITALKTNTGADLNLEATDGYIIQNNELAAKSGGKMKFKAGKDIITTDTNSRAKLKAKGLETSSTAPDLAYVSSTIVGPVADKNGNSITSLQTTTAGDGSTPSMVLEAANDVINNGITTIDAPDPTVKAGRHAIQNNILSFINPTKATIKAGETVQGDVTDGVGSDRANIAGKSDFVSTNVLGEGSDKSITNIVSAIESVAPELEMTAGHNGGVTTQGLINVDAKNAKISTPSNDYEMLGEINANTAFTLPNVDDQTNAYIFDNNSIYGTLNKERHPETTKGLLNVIAGSDGHDQNLDIAGGDIHGYNVYLEASPNATTNGKGRINVTNGGKATADNVMSTYSKELAITDGTNPSYILGDYTQVHTTDNMALAGEGSSFNLSRVAGKKGLTVYSDKDVNATGVTTLGDNSALRTALGDNTITDTSEYIAVIGKNVNVGDNATLTLGADGSTPDASIAAIGTGNDGVFSNEGTVKFKGNGKIGANIVDVNGGTINAGKDLGIFSKKGQEYAGATLTAGGDVTLQTDSTFDLVTNDLTTPNYISGITTPDKPTTFSNDLILSDGTTVNAAGTSDAATGYLNMFANNITVGGEDDTVELTAKKDITLEAAQKVTSTDSKIKSTDGDIALTGKNGEVKIDGNPDGASAVESVNGKVTVTGVGIKVKDADVIAKDANKLDATTGDLIVDNGSISGSSVDGKGKKVDIKNGSNINSTSGAVDLTATATTLDITGSNVTAANGLNGTAVTTLTVDGSTLEATAGDIALTAGDKATVKGNSTVDAKAGKTTITGKGVDIIASTVKANGLNTLDATTDDLILDGANATGGSLIGKGKNVISQNNKSTLKATDAEGTINLTADNNATFNADVDFEASTTNVVAAETITNNKKLGFKGNLNLNAKEVDFTNGSSAKLADGSEGSLKIVATGTGTAQDYNGAELKADNIYLKAEGGKINISSSDIEAKNIMSTRSKTIEFGASDKIKGDKTTISTIEDMNVKDNVKHVVGTTELTMHSDADVIVDGDATLKSGSKATLAAGHDVIVNSGNTVTFETPNGYVNAGNQVANAGNIVFNNDGQVAGKTVAVNGGSVKAGQDLAIYSQEDQTYVNADLEAGRNVRLQTDTPVNLITDNDTGYIKVGDPTAPDAYAHNININGKTVKATNGDLNMAANDINLANVTAEAGNKIKLDADQDLIFNNADVTANGKNLTADDRDALVGLAKRDVILQGKNTKLTAKDGNLVLKADSAHYGETQADGTADRSPNATGGVISNETGKGLMDTLYTTQNSDGTWKGYWNIFSNDEEGTSGQTVTGVNRADAAQALKDDPTLYVYDKNKPDYRIEKNRTVFYDDRRNKTDEKGDDPYDKKPTPPPGPEPDPDPDPDVPDNFDDSRLIQSAAEQPEEKTVWKRFDNHVDQTKADVNASVNRYIQSGDQYIDAIGQPMINGVSDVQKDDEQVGYYDDEE